MMRLAVGLLVVTACGGGSSAPGDSAADSPTDGPTCPRSPAAADRVRHVVVSHPYTASGGQSSAWEVIDLSAAGDLSRPNRTFTMGRATVGDVAFTPDGKIGIAPQEDGSLGVFSIDDTGVPTVIAAQFHGSFYAGRVLTAPDGRIYVLDDEWRENHGGIYELAVACDGQVSDKGLVAASKLPAVLAFVPGTQRAVLAAADIGSSAAGADAHLLAWGATPSVLASTDAFGDDMAIVGGATLSNDGGFFLIGDGSQFASVANRVAVVPVTGDTLGTPYVIANVMDPIELIASPFAETTLVVSGFGNAFYTIHRDTDGIYRMKGAITYQGAAPELPGGAVMIAAGSLRGRVLVAENLGVRTVELAASGVIDHGKFSLGSGTENVTGAIGVTP